MRRSICYSEPPVASAGDSHNWKFTYTTASMLPKGAKFLFDIGSKGRSFEWQIPSTNLKDKKNLIWAELPNGKVIPMLLVPLKDPLASTSFEFILPQEIKPGESLTIHMGTSEKEGREKGTSCQKLVQRRRPFQLFIDPKGKGDYKEPELFHVDVRGGPLKQLRILAPSLVSRNKRFDVIVRFEDAFGNLTSNAPEGTLIELSYEHLRENLNWKLFVPETGFIAIPNLYFNEEGIYKIQLRNLQNGDTFLSAPIKCLPEGSLSLYWGLLHGESPRFDSSKTIENYFRHMRDEKALQFIALSPFDSEEETSNEAWKQMHLQVAEFNEDDRFSAFLGFQWQGDPVEEGLRQFLYAKDAKPLLRKKDTKSNSLKKIYKTTNPKELISIPTFTMGKDTAYNFEDFHPEFERVVEIYNAWGSSEMSAKEGNVRPIQGGKKGITEFPEGSLIKALNRGCRFGFVAGGLDDRGCYQSLYDSDQVQYSEGLTAILSEEQNRSSLFEALQMRSCYATTGEKIILGLFIAGQKMGSELDSAKKPGLEYNRHITGYAIGTAPIQKAILLRNGKELTTFGPKEGRVEIEWDDTERLSQIALTPVKEGPRFVYYYLKVIQEDGHIAWSSPIWINAQEAAPSLKKGKKK